MYSVADSGMANILTPKCMSTTTVRLLSVKGYYSCSNLSWRYIGVGTEQKGLTYAGYLLANLQY